MLDPHRPASESAPLDERLTSATGPLKRYIQRIAPNSSDAADIYQESILRVIEQARTQPLRNPLAYAVRIARNLLLSGKRQTLSLETLDDLSSPLPCPEERTSQRQRAELLTGFLATMPVQRREVLIRRRLQGESREQIAAAMGLSEAAVKKHMTRALADLQRFLDNHRHF
ncbi:RNA polymerase sigma factor [Cellvibrio sp. KY-YJ-3]|uniref:RNA polymerase sigma factor n=1 Tax=Cellvibrio sp. KY-YJ-3 TaxID=454662 RepID=UPI001246179A|nr:sigma-70 family RNA polymerase sigma factor [Cellvibrio sp. KY-YJ-3]QEY11344.1 sigma-70 family RNA polymerase sigma factor [Cellvibrio sp. KY-YJ-3]